MTNFNGMNNLGGIFEGLTFNRDFSMFTVANYEFKDDGVTVTGGFTIPHVDMPLDFGVENAMTFWNVNEPGMPIHRYL